MALAYTPGLKVKEATLFSKERILPIAGEATVKIGDEVAFDTIVAKTALPGDAHIVKMAGQLGMEADLALRCMVKKMGDKVNKDEPIALLKMFFGLFKTYVRSPAEGTIENISKITGHVIIREKHKPLELSAYIPGKITKIIPHFGAIVETPAAYIQGIIGVGGETHGELMVIADSPDQTLTADKIGPDCAGKILVGGAMVTQDAVLKAIEASCNAIIVGGIEYLDLISILGYPLGVAITGHEDIGITLIATEGFGTMNMSERTFSILKKFEGRAASVNGATQIRAGVIRPEIVIPRPEIPHSKIVEETDIFSKGMTPGMPVRIIRDPHFGAIGNIINMPVELKRVESESQVRVMEVELEDGTQIMVPRANVEIIEE